MQYDDDELACQDPPSYRDSEPSNYGLEIPQKIVVAKRKAPNNRGGASKPTSKGRDPTIEGDQQVATSASGAPQVGRSTIDEFLESEFFKGGV